MASGVLSCRTSYSRSDAATRRSANRRSAFRSFPTNPSQIRNSTFNERSTIRAPLSSRTVAAYGSRNGLSICTTSGLNRRSAARIASRNAPEKKRLTMNGVPLDNTGPMIRDVSMSTVCIGNGAGTPSTRCLRGFNDTISMSAPACSSPSASRPMAMRPPSIGGQGGRGVSRRIRIGRHDTSGAPDDSPCTLAPPAHRV